MLAEASVVLPSHSSYPQTEQAKRPFPYRTMLGRRSVRAEHDRPLDLLDGLGDLDPSGAGLGAVERGPAPEHPRPLAEDLESLPGSPVAGVEDEAMGVDDGGRSHVGVIPPEDGAGGGAGGAEDAFRGVVEPFPLRGALGAFTLTGIL